MAVLKKWRAWKKPADEIVRSHDGDEKVRQELERSPVMTSSTETKGQYEAALKEVILELDIEAKYEALRLEIPRVSAGEENWVRRRVKKKRLQPDVYPPDFIATSLLVGGKQVIFEPHSGVNHDYLERMSRLREIRGNLFYFIVIKSDLDDASHAFVQLDVKGEHGKYVDELWHMPKIRLESKRAYNQEDYGQWKRMIKAELQELMQKRADGAIKERRAEAMVRARRL